MTGSTRIGGAKLKLTLGSPGTDYWADITAWSIDNEEADSDVVTFADAAEGGARQEFLHITATQSTASGSLWRYAFENVGEEVAFTIAPHGNATATENEPHLIGTVTIGPRPTIGSEANISKTYASTFEVTWQIVGQYTLDEGSD